MLDLKRTVDLVREALLDPERAWQSYLPDAGDWKRTALLLTGPLIVAAAIMSYVVGLLRGDGGLLGAFRPTLGSTVVTILMLAIAAAVVAFVFSIMAAAFRGRMSFALALAATTLAFVPGYVGSALSGLPWIGFLLSLALFIYALVLLWRILPVYLEAPVSSRSGYYVFSLLACIVSMAIVNLTIGGVLYGTSATVGGFDGSSPTARDAPVGGGILGQAAVLASASEDVYSPPADGRLTEQQVQTFIRVMQRTAELQAEMETRLRGIAERAENEDRLSLRDLGQLMRGATEMVGLQSTEVEVVKTGGGNWAEHQWVRETLRAAWIQRDSSPAIAHNYALYQRYQDQLTEFIAL